MQSASVSHRAPTARCAETEDSAPAKPTMPASTVSVVPLGITATQTVSVSDTFMLPLLSLYVELKDIMFLELISHL